ncbi:MAG: hypothetical protein II007_12630 [Gammaproteobacteria bacterium]|nr:hypothetical protein [Gammaproteobacteria bacterium]
MADISTLLDTISVYQTQYDQVDKLWNYFSVVTLAMVGFVIGNDKATRTIKEPLAILAVYWVFCIGNHAALIRGQEQLEQLGKLVTNQAHELANSGFSISLGEFKPLSTDSVNWFHLGVIAAISMGVMAQG